MHYWNGIYMNEEKADWIQENLEDIDEHTFVILKACKDCK